MTRHRNLLPQTRGGVFLTDSGLETHMIFHEGVELPHFAAFTLLATEDGRRRLRAYYRRHMAIAADRGLGFVLESPTWRASRDWGARLGHDARALRRINQDAIAFLADLRSEAQLTGPVIISGNVGPRGDGYRPDAAMTAAEAQAYHAEQVGWLAETDADLVSAFTLTTVAEAVGFARAASGAGLPSVVAFTVETDGRLPDGTPLREAIEHTDAETGGAPAYFMVNYAHPDHFSDAVGGGEAWLGRIGGLRANASRLSHAELDEAETLDDGDPEEFGHLHTELRRFLPSAAVLGGCCGTDHRHVERVAEACIAGPTGT